MAATARAKRARKAQSAQARRLAATAPGSAPLLPTARPPAAPLSPQSSDDGEGVSTINQLSINQQHLPLRRPAGSPPTVPLPQPLPRVNVTSGGSPAALPSLDKRSAKVARQSAGRACLPSPASDVRSRTGTPEAAQRNPQTPRELRPEAARAQASLPSASVPPSASGARGLLSGAWPAPPGELPGSAGPLQVLLSSLMAGGGHDGTGAAWGRSAGRAQLRHANAGSHAQPGGPAAAEDPSPSSGRSGEPLPSIGRVFEGGPAAGAAAAIPTPAGGCMPQHPSHWPPLSRSPQGAPRSSPAAPPHGGRRRRSSMQNQPPSVSQVSACTTAAKNAGVPFGNFSRAGV